MVEEDVKFACTMVYTLNKILLTSTELFELRNQLKDLNTKVDTHFSETFFIFQVKKNVRQPMFYSIQKCYPDCFRFKSVI